MKVREITITDLASPTRFNRIVISSPTFEQVEEAIRSLDNKARCDVALDVTEEQGMAISGGDGLYHCHVNPDMCALLNPDSLDEDEEYVEIVMGGQGTEIERRECVPLDLVIRAAKYYYEKGERDAALNWEQY